MINWGVLWRYNKTNGNPNVLTNFSKIVELTLVIVYLEHQNKIGPSKGGITHSWTWLDVCWCIQFYQTFYKAMF